MSASETDQEMIDRLRPFCGSKPISRAARSRFVHMADGDDARDAAMDWDEDHH